MVTDTVADTVTGPGAEEPRPPAPRGRFERFYAPGQGVEGMGRNGAAPAERPAPPAPPHARESLAPDEPLMEEGPLEAPRRDVRGAVGPLIDSLREVFTLDRALASQGGVSRCGLCYLHFPLADLIYREAEGFYVCQMCARALGPTRLTMVRRQQRL